jgi:hypothetical protein
LRNFFWEILFLQFEMVGIPYAIGPSKIKPPIKVTHPNVILVEMSLISGFFWNPIVKFFI